MYSRIYNYSPQAMPDALSTYYQTGMGSVLTPESLVAGEDLARRSNRMAGLGALFDMGGSFWHGLAVGVVAGVLGGPTIKRFLRRR